MSKVDTTAELISNHSTEEIVEYLSRVMGGVPKNYKVAVEKGDAALLYANLGDISLVAEVLRAINKQNQDRQARASMV